MRSATLWLLLIGLGTTGLAWGQTGKIAGRVTDANTGDPLIGVNVVIAGTTQGTVTDVEGYYTILRVGPGTYSVQASYLGFATVTVENVRVQIDKTTEVDFDLREEVLEGEEVVIVAERPLVEKDRTSTVASVSADELAALPVLNFSDVVNLQAGVVDGHFRGGRLGEVAYLVDGVPVNDVFNQRFAFQVENNAIQEVQIVSGTFNAEYGQAQSGVVNVVTKDGGPQYEGSFSAFAGDYLTRETDLFQRLDHVSLTGSYEVQGTLSGPVPLLGNRLTFFASGRFAENDGYLYGRRVVQPVDAEDGGGNVVLLDGREVFVPAFGDSAFVPMNDFAQWTGQVKLTARLWGSDKLAVNLLRQHSEQRGYDHNFRYNPEGVPTTFGDAWSATLTYSHIFGSKSFVDVRGAYFRNTEASYVYENPLDPRYPSDDALRQLGGNFSFFRGGARMDYFDRETETLVGKLDYTAQVTRRHQLKTGIEVKQHQLRLTRFEIKNNPSTNFEPALPAVGTPDHVRYSVEPLEAAFYLQDKMEFDYLVLNAGVRLDYFDANGTFPSDFGRPTTSPRVASEPKWQVSPRIGLAYPLSERGVVHVAYGHFFQVPPFSFLYTNPDYIYDPEEGLGRVFGNPALEPQQTIAYEIGLQQALTDIFGATLTVYYKDMRNLLGSRLEVIQPGFDEPFQLEKYGRYINRDYGQVRGLIAAFEKRMADGFAFNLDYTFQIARGNASDPRSVLLDEQSGTEPEKQLVPLDWDRRHQLNASLTVGEPGDWLATLIGRVGSGLPYTPTLADERIDLENSGRRRPTTTFDLYATKSLTWRGLRLGLFTRVFNLFDTQNEINVYGDTGRAFPNLRFFPGEPQGLNTKDEYLQRPDFYAAPRQVTLGLNFTF